MSLVTLSASYAAGGGEVGPALARRLNVPFVDRLIPTQVAAALGVPAAEARAHDEISRSLMARLLTVLGPIGEAVGGPGRWAEGLSDRDFLEMTERVILECAAGGGG